MRARPGFSTSAIPAEAAGRITSVTLKFPPTVIGDGKRDVRALIAADLRLSAVAKLLLPKLGAKAEQVPAEGETVRLVFVGNHCRGSTFKDGLDIVTPALAARIDEIMQDMPEVYFTRLDLRYELLGRTARGAEFHDHRVQRQRLGKQTRYLGPGNDLARRLRHAVLPLRRILQNRRRYAQARLAPAGWRKLASLWRYQKRLMAAYPAND